MSRFGTTITVAAGKMPSSQSNFDWIATESNFPTAATAAVGTVVDSIGGNDGNLVGGVTYDATGATFDGVSGLMNATIGALPALWRIDLETTIGSTLPASSSLFEMYDSSSTEIIGVYTHSSGGLLKISSAGYR